MRDSLGDRKATLCRELTKRYESAFLSSLEELCSYYQEQDPKGECVLVIEGKSVLEKEEEDRGKWMELSVEEHMAFYEGQGIQRKEAMKRVAKDRGTSKREIYQRLLTD